MDFIKGEQMIILDKPYISDLLKKTVEINHFPVLKNSETEGFNINNNIDLWDSNYAVNQFKQQIDEPVYCNSENAIDWIVENLYFTDIPQKIKLFKDKVLFRKLISNIYPDFYFTECRLDELNQLDYSKIKFPVVLKPSVGFLSFGVYVIYDRSDWINVIKKLKSDIEKFQSIFPKTVVDTSKFIIEELIEGDEYAVDVYFDNNGHPAILNIFKHPFVSETDVSDRVYYTSKKIIKSYLNDFNELFVKIGKAAELKNFPAHIELRVNEKNIIPIEVNPMRFTGWCLTDLAYYAWGINVYEYYINRKKPDWNKILAEKDDSLYYFTVAEIPQKINNENIKKVKYDEFIQNFANPLDLRKLDYKKLPLFAEVFARTEDYNEIEKILALDLNNYITI